VRLAREASAVVKSDAGDQKGEGRHPYVIGTKDRIGIVDIVETGIQQGMQNEDRGGTMTLVMVIRKLNIAQEVAGIDYETIGVTQEESGIDQEATGIGIGEWTGSEVEIEEEIGKLEGCQIVDETDEMTAMATETLMSVVEVMVEMAGIAAVAVDLDIAGGMVEITEIERNKGVQGVAETEKGLLEQGLITKLDSCQKAIPIRIQGVMGTTYLKSKSKAQNQ